MTAMSYQLTSADIEKLNDLIARHIAGERMGPEIVQMFCHMRKQLEIPIPKQRSSRAGTKHKLRGTRR